MTKGILMQAIQTAGSEQERLAWGLLCAVRPICIELSLARLEINLRPDRSFTELGRLCEGGCPGRDCLPHVRLISMALPSNAVMWCSMATIWNSALGEA